MFVMFSQGQLVLKLVTEDFISNKNCLAPVRIFSWLPDIWKDLRFANVNQELDIGFRLTKVVTIFLFRWHYERTSWQRRFAALVFTILHVHG